MRSFESACVQERLMVIVCDRSMSCLFSIFNSDHGVSEASVYFDGTDRWVCGSSVPGACGMGESWDGLVCTDLNMVPVIAAAGSDMAVLCHIYQHVNESFVLQRCSSL